MNILPDEKCAFNLIYKFDRHYSINGRQVGDIRKNIAFHIAENLKELGLSFDIVSPIPNTGFFYAEAVADYLNSELMVLFEKSTARRTLGKNKEDRILEYKNLLMHVDMAPKGASVLFIDEAMLSGLTVNIISRACKENGIDNYSYAFASPITRCQCPWGHIKNTERYFSDLTGRDQFDIDYYRKALHRLKEETGAEDILFMPTSRFSSVIDTDATCTLCFFEDAYIDNTG